MVQKPKAPEAHKQDGNGQNTLTALKSYRYISPQADRVLDAPDIADDFYTNILDWGSENKVWRIATDTATICLQRMLSLPHTSSQ